MRHRSNFSLGLIVLVLTAFSLSFCIPATAATENPEAVRKLNSLSDQEIAELDTKLEEALIHYYDEEFSFALPILLEIAETIETMDVMYWIGTSADKTGNLTIAEEYFKKMLAIDSGLHKARLGLASIFLQQHKNSAATSELNQILSSSPPKGIAKKARELLVDAGKKPQKISWNLRVSQGFIRDDNVNAGPDHREYELHDYTLTFKDGSTFTKQGDTAAITSISGNVMYDMGAKKGIMWNTAANLYSKVCFDLSDYNFMSVTATTGPVWSSGRDIVRIPMGYTHRRYGGDRLSYAFHAAPSYQHYFSRTFSIKALYSISKTNYYDNYSDTITDLNNTNQRFELIPTFYLGNRKHIFAVKTGYNIRKVGTGDLRKYEYDDPYLGLSYIARFPSKTEFFLRFRLDRRNYNGEDIFYHINRRDKRSNIKAILSQEIWKNLSASISLSYTKNNSNLELKNYNKAIAGISIAYKF